MTYLQSWIRKSREEQALAPDRYLISYPQLRCDKEHVYLTVDTLVAIEANCGRYDHTFPTGEYLGKMFLRGQSLMWYGLHPTKARTHKVVNARKIALMTQERLDEKFPRKDS